MSFPFNLSVVRDVERVGVTSKKYYHFIRQRAESETAKYRSDMYEKREEENEWMRELYEHWGIMTPEIEEFLSRRYIERIVGCVENVTNKNCTLPAGEKKVQIRKMINDPKARAAVSAAVPKSKYMKLMLIPIKMKSTALTYLEGKVISSVKSGNQSFSQSLKREDKIIRKAVKKYERTVFQCYNAGLRRRKYLRDTLDSVLRQTFADFELILVDDCSKDGSGKICDEVAASDSRVRVIHKEKNGGASSARNLGTKSASGKYLYYMDSDDKIDSDIFEKMYSASRDASPTVVMFGAVEEYYDKTGKLYMTNPVSYESKVLSGKENVAKEVIKIENTTLFGYLWN